MDFIKKIIIKKAVNKILNSKETNKMFEKLGNAVQGKKTYITGGIMILLWLLEKKLGVDIPGVDVPQNFLTDALLGMFIRKGVDTAKSSPSQSGVRG